jgi:ketosteroid isomerase-like protein
MGDWAYCWNHLSVTVTPLEAGLPQRRTGYTLTILQKKPDGGWVIARDANMLTPEPSTVA